MCRYVACRDGQPVACALSFRFIAPARRQQKRSPQLLVADPLARILDRQGDPFLARRCCNPDGPGSHRTVRLKGLEGVLQYVGQRDHDLMPRQGHDDRFWYVLLDQYGIWVELGFAYVVARQF